ncbi:MAG: CHAT domain-containing protein, partial [Acidobacteriota bacterium]
SSDEILTFKAISTDILFEAAYHPSPLAYRAAAIIHLLKGELSEAINSLEKARQGLPTNPQVLNDLAVAYFTQAEYNKDPQDLIRALKMIDIAVTGAPFLAEAKFNRALILERLYLYKTACSAWQEYLNVESSPTWTAEARKRLVGLEQVSATINPLEVYTKLAVSMTKGDLELTKSMTARFPQLARRYVLEKLLPTWAEAILTIERDYTKIDEANHQLKLAATIGLQLAAQEHDKLISDLVSEIYIDNRMTRERLYRFAQALIDYHNGRQLLEETNKFEKARVKFKRSYNNFKQLNATAFVILTALQLARCEIICLNYTKAFALLEEVRVEAEHRGYQYIMGRAWWAVAAAQFYTLETSSALSSIYIALNYLEEAADTESIARIHLFISEILDQIGARDEIWQHQHAALDYLTRLASPRRVSVLNGIASQIANKGELEIALYYHNEAIAVAQHINDHLTIANVFLRRSLLYHKLSNQHAALEDLANAKRYQRQIDDKITSQRLQQEILMVEGNIKVSSQPINAISLFTRLINYYRKTSDRYRITNLYLSRARAYLKLGNKTKAESDLRTSIKEFEKQRENLNDDTYRTAFLGETQSVYDEIISFHILHRHHMDKAFDYAETARARSLLDALNGEKRIVHLGNERRLFLDNNSKPLKLAQIQQELPSDVMLIEYSLLADQLLAWVIKRNSAKLITTSIERSRLAQQVSELRSAIEHAEANEKFQYLSGSLYDLVFRKLKQAINSPPDEKPHYLVIVPDKELHLLPFAALVDPLSGKYLIQEYKLSFAPSATMFVRCLQQDRQLASQPEQTALVIGNPTFDEKLFPDLPYLPYAEKEAKQIAACYTKSGLLVGKDATKQAFLSRAGHYSIVHFAGHSIMNGKSPLSSILIFAPAIDAKPGTDGALPAYKLYENHFPRTRLVVLAACRTASGRLTQGEGLANLARPFLAAGVPATIASLWDAEDETSAQLFINFHNERSKGKNSLDALNAAQLACLTSDNPMLRSPSVWASFILLGGCTTQ